MGVFGALSTAVSGLRAQSSVLQNISTNIANANTAGFKRIDTKFVDIVTSRGGGEASSGAVVASAAGTNNVQGDLQNSQVSTHIAVNGDGFFYVAEQSQQVDGRPVFESLPRFTRRGDFDLDQNGYLVNGAGYYLNGQSIDNRTGNPVGGVPGVIQVSDNFLPARATTEIIYRANLPSEPRTVNSQAGFSYLYQTGDYDNDPTTEGAGNNNGFIRGDNVTAFLSQTISGGAVTAYDGQGRGA